jgi:dipeptidyl aminopeptidase/acylaminoacyl peptidase
VTNGEDANDEPALSPDGRWLAFHSSRQPDGIYVQLAAGGTTRPLVEGGRLPRFSPNGEWIAYLNTGENVADIAASNMSRLYRIPATGGKPLRLASNALSVQGAAWNTDSRSVLFLATDERGMLRLWNAPLNGEAAALTPEFIEGVHLYGRACAVTGNRFLYAAFNGETRILGEFFLKPPFGATRFAFTAAPSKLEISGCTASANGTVLADEIDGRSSTWVLPIAAQSGVVQAPPSPLTLPERGGHFPQFTPDGKSFLFQSDGASILQDYRTGTRKLLTDTRNLSTDGLFALQVSEPLAGATPPVFKVVNLKSGESWGRLQTDGMPWDLSGGGKWVLAASTQVHRTIIAWDTRTAEHQAIYSHPTGNLYLANFSQDGRWVLFTTQETGRPSGIWAAPFRGLRNVPVTEWVDLGEGDYPRWSPSGERLYFTRLHDGFECIFTRSVHPTTKRPVGRMAGVQHFHGQASPQGMRPGTFRISVAQDKMAFALGERTHRLLQLRQH